MSAIEEKLKALDNEKELSEEEVEAELGYRKGYLASIMSTKREIQTLEKTSEGA